MVGLIKSHYLLEGRSSAIQREDGELDETLIHQASGEATIKMEKLVDFTDTTIALVARDGMGGRPNVVERSQPTLTRISTVLLARGSCPDHLN
jgi:hypothetical protein